MRAGIQLPLTADGPHIVQRRRACLLCMLAWSLRLFRPGVDHAGGGVAPPRRRARELTDGLDPQAQFAFLPKPFTLPQLAAKVKEELAR